MLLNKIWSILSFKVDLSKIHDNVDVVWVENEIISCGMKKESSRFIYLFIYFYGSKI